MTFLEKKTPHVQGIGFAIPRANTFPFFCVKHKKHQIQRIWAGNVQAQKTPKVRRSRPEVREFETIRCFFLHFE